MKVFHDRTVLQSIIGHNEYIMNPEKTDGGRLVSSYGCDPKTVSAEYFLAHQQYHAITGREQNPKKEVLLYRMRQSFKPGEITPEEANRLGYELAKRFTKGKYQFLVTTHVDKSHIHNHISICSVSVECDRKFRNFWGSSRAVQRISDRLCLENGLSVVENPKPKRENPHSPWTGEQKPVSGRDKVRAGIDAALQEKPKDFEAFLKAMEAAGFGVIRGRHLTFHAPGQKKNTRCRTLGEDYTEEAIRERLEGKRVVSPRPDRSAGNCAQPVNLLIDIQAKLQAGKGEGYARWAKLFNVKQMAQTLNYLTDNGLLDYAKLKERAEQGATRFHEYTDTIRKAEARMGEIAALEKQIMHYSDTREVYAEYRKAGYSKKYYAEHESEILLHKAAKAAFDALHLQKLPTMKTLKAEFGKLLAEKKTAYATYNIVKKEMQDLLAAKANVDKLLGYDLENKENIAEKENGNPKR